MSDSEDSTVTYTTVSSPYEGQSGDVSPGVDRPPVMSEDLYVYVVATFQALPPPDYVPGPEEPKQAPPSPVYIPYVLEPVYPKADRPELTLPPRKRLSIVHCPGYESGESLVAASARPIEGRRADYGFVDSVEAEIRRQRA
nr:hypothetical protein [Tanacetum cinerariifolium]